ncbi:MAG: ROK family protein [Chlorobi bacterium]|nr:ROK family protein [Chlorobiota bacterium]
MKDVTIGIDIGGTNTVLGIVDRSGMILSENSISTTQYPDVNNYVAAVHEAIEKTLTGVGEKVSLKAIGIGAPNGNYYQGTIEYPPNLVWEGVIPLCKYFSKYYTIPVVLTNDANAAALGEMIFGGAKGLKNFIVYTLGTGLGSGIVINGEVLYGHTGFAGEIGHIIMVPGGRDCGCGRQGCLETYASASGIVRTVGEILSLRRAESPLRYITPHELTAKKITEAAENGDPVALEVFDKTASMLALSIVNAVAFSSPEAIFLFGGLANAGKYLFKPIEKYINENIQVIFRNTVKLLPSQLMESNAAVLGASALAWKELEH